MTRQEMIQRFDGGASHSMPKMRAAEKRSRAEAHRHIKAALAELEQIGPQCVSIGKAIMDAELLLNGVIGKIESEA